MSLEESGIDTLCSSMDKVSTSTSGPSKKTAPSKKPSAPLYVPPRARSKSPEELKSNGDDADDDDASWDTIYDDSGNCIKPELVEEFKSTIGIKPDKQVLVQQAKCDMSDKLNGSIHPHVLELHDFDPSLKESDIAMRLSSLNRSRNYDVVWVDDTHALLVFTSEEAAKNALAMVMPDLKMRPLSEASSASILKAGKSVDRLLPPKRRPPTSSSAAVRLIEGHLGVRGSSSREQRKAEAKSLREAKDRRRMNREQAEAVWEGNV